MEINAIKQIRWAYGWRQEDLAEILNKNAKTHCTKKDISRWENGKHIPNYDTQKVLAQLAEMSVYDLQMNLQKFQAEKIRREQCRL